MPALIVDGMSVFRTVAGQAALLDRGYGFSFVTQLTSAIRKFACGPVYVCWEGGFGGRDKIHPGYKAGRVKPSALISQQRAEIQQLLTHAGVDQMMAPGYEGDDVVAFLANTLPYDCIIYSNDKDVLQLINDRVSVYQRLRIKGAKKDRVLITDANFQRLTGWPDPDTWFLAQLAMGDAVDGVPKIPLVGEGIIHAYHMGMEIDDAKRNRLDEFYAGSDHFVMNKLLMDLRDVRELPVVMTSGKLNRRKCLDFLQEIGFASIVRKFDEWFDIYARASKSSGWERR